MSNIPTKDAILEWITENPTLTAKRDIAKAFGIKGAARIDLKRILKELEAEGHLEKRGKSYPRPGPSAACVGVDGHRAGCRWRSVCQADGMAWRLAGSRAMLGDHARL